MVFKFPKASQCTNIIGGFSRIGWLCTAVMFQSECDIAKRMGFNSVCNNANSPITITMGEEGFAVLFDILAGDFINSTREFIAKNLFNTVPLCPIICGDCLK